MTGYVANFIKAGALRQKSLGHDHETPEAALASCVAHADGALVWRMVVNLAGTHQYAATGERGTYLVARKDGADVEEKQS